MLAGLIARLFGTQSGAKLLHIDMQQASTDLVRTDLCHKRILGRTAVGQKTQAGQQ